MKIHKMSREHLSLRRTDHSNFMMKTLEGLLESNVLVDCTLSAGGRFLKAHKIILSSCSPYFQTLFTQDMNNNPTVVFKDIEYKYLKMVLEFVYCGEVQVSQTQLSTFLEVAHSLKIQGLGSRNREINSEESSSEIAVSNPGGNEPQISQQSGEDVAVSKPTDIVDSDNCINLDAIPAPAQSNADSLESTSAIHIQSVYTLASDSPSIPHDSVTEDCPRSISLVSDSKCNVKIEPMSIDGNLNGQVINRAEQGTDSNATQMQQKQMPSLRNKYSSPDSIGSTKEIHSDHNCTMAPATGPNHRVKRAKQNSLSSGPECVTHSTRTDTTTNNVENVSRMTKPVIGTNHTEKQRFPESISQAASVHPNGERASNPIATTELVTNSIHSIQSLKNKCIVSECVVQAERIIVDRYIEGNATTSAQQRKVSRYRIIRSRKDSEKSPAVEEEKSIRVLVKERKSYHGAEKAPEVSTGHAINLPLSAQVSSSSKKSSGSEGPKSEGKPSRSTCSQNEEADVKILTALNPAFDKSRSGSKNVWSCQVCDKLLGSKITLNRHMQLHTGEKPYSCSICKKEFAHRTTLNSHERTHTGEKPYKCDLCNKSFTQIITLTRHRLTHSGQKPFMCKLCPMKFTQHPHLIRHLRTHTKEKPYECNICERRFSLKENLVCHIRIHTGEKPYECSVCNKVFAQYTTMTRHVQTHNAQ